MSINCQELFITYQRWFILSFNLRAGPGSQIYWSAGVTASALHMLEARSYGSVVVSRINLIEHDQSMTLFPLV